MNYKQMLLRQLDYNNKVLGDAAYFGQQKLERHTQELALCAHAEISSLINATNFRTHHGNLAKTNKDTILFESVDVIRYMMAIQNLWGITDEEFEEAFEAKDVYLNMCYEMKKRPWDNQYVAIVDLDDVVVEFRKGFAAWLSKEFNIHADVNSSEYYFITALKKARVNPEDIFSKFIADGGFRTLEIKENIRETLVGLKQQGFWIQYLTARPAEDLRCLYDTFYWINKFNLPYDAIDFSSEKFRWCAKSKYYDRRKICFAIDDSPKHAEEYAKHGIKVFVPKQNYNKHVSHDNVFFYEEPYEILRNSFFPDT